MSEFFEKIDWSILRRQKQSLISAIGKFDGDIKDDLNGILHLIDGIQDYAVDKLKINARFIFGRGADYKLLSSAELKTLAIILEAYEKKREREELPDEVEVTADMFGYDENFIDIALLIIDKRRHNTVVDAQYKLNRCYLSSKLPMCDVLDRGMEEC